MKGEFIYGSFTLLMLTCELKLTLFCNFGRIFTDEFRSKVACHNDVAQLECNPYSRIAVYSASFGRTEYESIQCPQPQGVREESKYYPSFFVP